MSLATAVLLLGRAPLSLAQQIEVEALPAAEFEARARADEALVINVHVPYEGEMPDTDAHVPFDQISDAVLPPDRDAPIALYCMSGRMSEIAAKTLLSMGYRRVYHLKGGMRAWEAAGRPLFKR